MDNPVVAHYLTQPGGLAHRLREARTAAGFGVRQLAGELGWQPSKVSRIEGGKTIPTVDDVERWARVCELKARPAAALVKAVEAARVFHLERRQLGRPRARQIGYNDLHAEATSVTMVEALAIPGPLQTLDYAKAVLTVGYLQLDRPLVGIEGAARTRLDRGRHLDDETRQYRFVVSAQVFRTLPEATSREQVEVIASAIEADHIEFVIVPDRAGVLVLHSFAIYDSLVIVETLSGELVHDASTDAESAAIVEHYRQVADRFAAVGELATPDTLAGMIHKVSTG